MYTERREERSGYYVARMNQLLAILESSEYEHEANLLRTFIKQYLDLLVGRSSRSAFRSDDSWAAFLIVCSLLEMPAIAGDICQWLREAVICTGEDRILKSMMDAGIFGPSLEPPIQWTDDAEVRRVNCLLSFLCEKETMWAPIWAYADHFESTDEQLERMQEDVKQVNSWRVAWDRHRSRSTGGP